MRTTNGSERQPAFPARLRLRAPLSTGVGVLLGPDSELAAAGYEVVEIQRGSSGPHVLFLVHDDEGLAVFYAACTAAALAAGTDGVAAMSEAWDDGRGLRERARAAGEALQFALPGGETVSFGRLTRRLWDQSKKSLAGGEACQA